MMEPDKLTAWETGYELHSYSFTRKEDGWLLCIRVNSMKGGRLVTFIATESVMECWQRWYAAITGNAYKLEWARDKFA